jgi:hypothetical protein
LPASPEIPLRASDRTIRRQARFLGKPVRAPAALNAGAFSRTGWKEANILKQMHGLHVAAPVGRGLRRVFLVIKFVEPAPPGQDVLQVKRIKLRLTKFLGRASVAVYLPQHPVLILLFI